MINERVQAFYILLQNNKFEFPLTHVMNFSLINIFPLLLTHLIKMGYKFLADIILVVFRHIKRFKKFIFDFKISRTKV